MRKHKVVISNNIANQPSEHELMVALLLTKLLSTDIEFVRTESHRTPDFIINGELWELKSPKGNSSSAVCAYNQGNIFNVFVQDYKSSLYGLCFNNSKTGQYYNCIMHQLYKDYNKHIGTDEATSTSLLKGISFYQNTAEEYQKAANSLNEWIDVEGKELYPTLTFRRWTTDPIQKVIFE